MERLIISEKDKDREYIFTSRLVTIGRSTKNTITIQDQSASRRHCQIVKVGDQWFAVDCSSHNGTFVNGTQITKKELKSKDQITIGSCVLTFLQEEGEKEEKNKPKEKDKEKGFFANILHKQGDKKSSTGEDRDTSQIEDMEKTDEETPEPLNKEISPDIRGIGEPVPKQIHNADNIALLPIEPPKVKVHRPSLPLPADFEDRLAYFCELRDKMKEEIAKVIIGQDQVIQQIMAAIFAGGHCLLVGVPGLAKTAMVSTISHVLELSFKRVQFTPDLMPSDITGTNVIDEAPNGKREFRFVPGPIFANIVLADEINRTPPKTQAALLEAMQEKQVTVGNVTYPLPEPFFVIATQNPIEQEGTYPLPEAQLDRFMFNINVSYPSFDEEIEILEATTGGEVSKPSPMLTGKDILGFRELVRNIVISKYLVEYVTMLVRSTRPKEQGSPDFINEMVSWGAGPRAGQYLIRGGKALAAMDGRPNVSVEDIKNVAIPVMRHRIGVNFHAQSKGIDTIEIIERLVATVSVPNVPRFV